MKENRKKTIRLAVLVLILFLGIGYAALTANLKINGTVNVDKATWDVHFENVNITEGSVEANPAPTTNNIDTTEMTYTINFTKPGDFFEFTTDMVNDGTIDAMVELVTNTTYASNGTTEIQLPGYLENKVTYEDGGIIKPNHLLAHETSEKIKVRVEFKKDISVSDLPSDGDTTVVFKFSGNFKQADENAKPPRVNFATSSLDDIVDAYNNHETTSLQAAMENKVTRELKMDLDNDGTDETYHLRIANLSTPAECSTQGYSQTACGFVLEFVEIIDRHAMNSTWPPEYPNWENGGGWEKTEMRKYLNTDEGSVFSKLPSALQSKIIDTTPIVSSTGAGGPSNDTTDKLYLFSTAEIGLPQQFDNRKDPSIHTRTLDYYTIHNTASDKRKKHINEDTDSEYWLRSANSNTTGQFFLFSNSGVGSNGAPCLYGVSPAFRIG